jgi:hypothetical protein
VEKRQRDIARKTELMAEEREEEEEWVRRLQGDVVEEQEIEAHVEEVPESWEERFEEGENVFDFGRKIFQSDDSIRSREEELKKLEVVLRKEVLKIDEKVEMDRNCFYRCVEIKLGLTHMQVRRTAINWL